MGIQTSKSSAGNFYASPSISINYTLGAGI